MNALSVKQQQRGAALFTALIFLIIITMLSLAAMRSSVLELRMASNQELKNSAFQRAQAVADATMGDSANMPSLSTVNATNCMSTDPDKNELDADGEQICKTTEIKLDADYLSDHLLYFNGDIADGEIYSRVTRLAPLVQPAPRSIGTSASVYSVASYQVDATYDLSRIGQGKAQIREGVMLLIAN